MERGNLTTAYHFNSGDCFGIKPRNDDKGERTLRLAPFDWLRANGYFYIVRGEPFGRLTAGSVEP